MIDELWSCRLALFFDTSQRHRSPAIVHLKNLVTLVSRNQCLGRFIVDNRNSVTALAQKTVYSGMFNAHRTNVNWSNGKTQFHADFIYMKCVHTTHVWNCHLTKNEFHRFAFIDWTGLDWTEI